MSNVPAFGMFAIGLIVIMLAVRVPLLVGLWLLIVGGIIAASGWSMVRR